MVDQTATYFLMLPSGTSIQLGSVIMFVDANSGFHLVTFSVSETRESHAVGHVFRIALVLLNCRKTSVFGSLAQDKY